VVKAFLKASFFLPEHPARMKHPKKTKSVLVARACPSFITWQIRWRLLL